MNAFATADPRVTTNDDADAARFVEDMALALSDNGMPRMAGRILARLLICVPEHQSAAELGEALQASKASISTMTRLLINFGLVERVALPGRRETRLRMKPGVWANLFGDSLARVVAVRRLAERGRSLLADQPAEVRVRLDEMYELHLFMEREFPALLARWERERGLPEPLDGAAD